MFSRADLNAEIALHFGFKKSVGKQFLVDGLPQWTYPSNWYLAQGGVPNTSIPDFVQILQDYLALRQKHRGGGPREWFGQLDICPKAPKSI